MAALVSALYAELIALGRYRTARAYRTTWKRFCGFTGKESLSGEELTPGLIHSFERRLRDEKLSLNTISFYMRNLRVIYNKGAKLGYFEKNENCPFTGTYTKVAPTRKRALTKEEMRRLNDLLEKPVLRKEEKESLPLFLFAFHACGMCFVDLAHLKKEDVGQRLGYYWKKTGQYIEVKVTPEMKTLMHMFKRNSSGFIFPVIRDEKKPTGSIAAD